RLRAAQDCCEGLNGGACDIIFRMLCCERYSGCLGMTAQHPGARIFCTVAFAHQACPQAATRPKLGDLLKEVVVHIEEEGEAWRELVDLESTLEGSFHIGQSIGQCKSKLLNGGGSCFTDMVTTNADGVPAGHVA